jgi:hypothetical protein
MTTTKGTDMNKTHSTHSHTSTWYGEWNVKEMTDIAKMILCTRFNADTLGNGTPISDAILNAHLSGRMVELEQMLSNWVSSVCTDEFLK